MPDARTERRHPRQPRPGSVDAAACEAEARHAELAARVADLRARIGPGVAFAALVLRAPALAIMAGRGAVALARAHPVATGLIAGAATAGYAWRHWSGRGTAERVDTGPGVPGAPPARTVPAAGGGSGHDDRQENDPLPHVTGLDHALAQGLVVLDGAIRAGASVAGDAAADLARRTADAAARTAASVPGAVDRHPLSAIAASALAGAALAAMLPAGPRPLHARPAQTRVGTTGH